MTDRLDGNAIAGTLSTAFRGEMTAVFGTCGTCGARGRMAELAVYVNAPGVVGNCPHCDAVLLVIVERDGVSCVDVSGFADLGAPV
jgi:hypothetical protein